MKNQMSMELWLDKIGPGNVQVSIIHKDGLDYLLITNINLQFGSYYFHYQVQVLDTEGREYIVEDQTVSFDNFDTTTREQKPLSEEQKEEIQDFKERVTSWFEGATLLVATDVDNLEQYVTTPTQSYTPEQYYDEVWVRYLD